MSCHERHSEDPLELQLEACDIWFPKLTAMSTPPRIAFNEEIDPKQIEEHRAKLLASAEAVLDYTIWDQADPDTEIATHTCSIEVINAAEGTTASPCHAIRTSIVVPAPRSKVFALVSDRSRSAEWDPTHTGSILVHDFDTDCQVYRDFSKLSMFGNRGGLFFGLTLPDARPGVSLFCDHSVRDKDAPAMSGFKRVEQQLFMWIVEDVPEGGCRLTAILTMPLDGWKLTDFVVVQKSGWRDILRKLRKGFEGESASG